MTKYRIKWTATRTGKTGHGTGKFSLLDASSIVRDLNEEECKQRERYLEYEIEAVPEDEL